MGPAFQPKSDYGDHQLSNGQSLGGYIASQMRVYHAFAKGLFFVRFGGDQTCFDHKVGAAVISAVQLKRLGIVNPAQVDFIVMHELGHFREFLEDPAGYRALLDSFQSIESPQARKATFNFYNALLDIYVNRNSANQAPQFAAPGGFGPEVKSLYREKLFAGRDFSTLPYSRQYGSYLLNSAMGVGEDIQLSAAVREALNRPVNLYGTRYSQPEVITKFLVPAIGKLRTDGWQATVSQRVAVIQRTLLPIFQELLAGDNLGGRSGEPDGAFESLEPDMDGASDAVAYGEAVQRERNLTPAERAERDLRRQAGDLARQAGLEDINGFSDALVRVQPTVRRLVDLFKRLQQRSLGTEPVQQGHFKTGDDLDVDQAILSFDKVLTAPSQAEVMVRTGFETTQSLNPARIRLWVCADLSGSMSNDIPKLRETILAQAAAMVTISEEHRTSNTGLVGELAVVGFADNVVKLLEPKSSLAIGDVAGVFAKINADGGTSEYTALKYVCDLLSALQESGDQERDTLNVLVVVTDGNTASPHLSIQYIEALRKLGVVCLGVKLGTVPRPDIQPDPNSQPVSVPMPESRFVIDTFSQVWGASGRYIAQLEMLPGVLERELSGYIMLREG